MIEIIIIGGYFTYPPEGKTVDTRLIGERISVPEDSSLAAIRARATTTCPRSSASIFLNSARTALTQSLTSLRLSRKPLFGKT